MPDLRQLQVLLAELNTRQAKLVAVSKTKTVPEILEVYQAGHKIFGENKAQEMCRKYEQLPKDTEWHMIGHLQSNKVKYIAPFVSLIHSVDSMKLLQEVNKQAARHNRVIDCLLQVHIAKEETKFGLDETEAEQLLQSEALKQLKNVRIVGLMGMATNTEQVEAVRDEFRCLSLFFQRLQEQYLSFRVLSMGMSGDYRVAIEEGSNLVRIGSLIFGERETIVNQ